MANFLGSANFLRGKIVEARHGVAMVALLDAPDVAATSKRWRFARERLRSFSTALETERSIGFPARAWRQSRSSRLSSNSAAEIG